MGARGPQRKAGHLKLIAGTDRQDRPDEQSVEVAAPLESVPPPPAWLPNEHAVAEWHRMASILVPRGGLDELRISELGRYCALHGKIIQAYQAGTMPSADAQKHCERMLKGFIGGAQPVKATEPGPKAGRFAGLKRRAAELDG